VIIQARIELLRSLNLSTLLADNDPKLREIGTLLSRSAYEQKPKKCSLVRKSGDTSTLS